MTVTTAVAGGPSLWDRAPLEIRAARDLTEQQRTWILAGGPRSGELTTDPGHPLHRDYSPALLTVHSRTFQVLLRPGSDARTALLALIDCPRTADAEHLERT